MALIKYGGGVVQASGSVAGTTHARNRFGNYVRARTKPVNPRSSGQNGIRTALSYLVEYWANTLTAAQRTAWGTYAVAVTMKNRLGENINLTGFNHFIRSNAELVNRGLTLVAAGPTTLALPEQDPTMAGSASVAAGVISIAFDADMDWCDEDEGHMMIYMGRPQPATRNFFNGPWQYAGKIDGDSVTPPTSPQTVTPPFTLVEGQKVWIYARIVREDGRLTERFYSDFVVAA